MKRAVILLIGEQPAPNLLPTRWLEPDAAVLVYTNRTQQVAENLRNLLETDLNCLLCPVPPYNIPEIQGEMRRFLSENLPEHAFTFNLTGGTKPMVLAAFGLAHLYSASFLYFQTQGNQSRLYHYIFAQDGIHLEKVDELSDTITLDDYLRMYLDKHKSGEPRNELERQVRETLQAIPDLEVLWSVCPQGLGALEIDFIVRLGNQVGVGEVKTKGAKAGIDQINAVAEQRHLGTYIHKFLVSGKLVHPNNKSLAQAYGIEVIELPSFGNVGALSTEDRQKLTQSIIAQLGGHP